MSEKILLKAIRARCLDCCGDLPKEVRLCTIPNCALYPYRMGKKPPALRRKMSDKQLANLRLANQACDKKSIEGAA